MSEPATPIQDEKPPTGDATASPPLRLRDVWQAPVLGVAAVALAVGIVAAVRSAPKPDVSRDLREAGIRVEQGEYGEALETLNTVVLPHLNNNHLSVEERGAFHLFRARALYLGQRQAGVDRRENHERVKSEFALALKNGARITPDDEYYLANTSIALEEYDEATRLAERMGEANRDRRVGLLKEMVERSMRRTPPDRARALDLVTTLASDPALPVNDRVWTLTRQGELLIDTGYTDDAITKIVRTLPRLEGADRAALGELLVTLAKAYVAEGGRSDRPDEASDRMSEARKQLERAAGLIGEDHPLNWLVVLLRAEIDHHQGDLDDARRRYAQVVEQYNFASGRPVALLGLAEVEAQLAGRESSPVVDASALRYEQLVEEYLAGERHPEVTRERIGASLTSRALEQSEKGRVREALRFADIGERLYGADDTPADLVHILGESHQALAEEGLRREGGDELMTLAEADPTTQREAREHLLKAGDYYRRHAAKLVLTDAKEYARSLWAAGEAFDRAGDLESAIAVFRLYAQDFPSDARRPVAVYRLAQAQRARGDLEVAASLFQELIDSRGQLEGSGSLADACYVPLAQTMLMDASPDNDERAEQLLLRVVGGEAGGPETRAYREALLELGSHYHRTGRYAQAIERLEEYVAQSGDREPQTLYTLAESYRQSGAAIGRSLLAGMPDGAKRDLVAQRQERLARAESLYGSVREAYEAKEHRTALEGVRLRNAYFYEADCAFDLKDYAGAIRRYDAARERFPRDPASLVALTQTVSALLAMGERDKALAVNERAKRFIKTLPDSVWDDPALPMGRAAWERWLDAQATLGEPAEGARREAGAGDGR